MNDHSFIKVNGEPLIVSGLCEPVKKKSAATDFGGDDIVKAARKSKPKDNEMADSHLSWAAKEILVRPDRERISRILADIIIQYDELHAVVNEAFWLVEEPRCSRARGLFVCGANGSGKTVLLKIICHRYPVGLTSSFNSGDKRVLAVNLSGVRTTKGLLAKILDASNVPYSMSRNATALETIVHDTLTAMNCRLLITDETQDILHGQAQEQLRVIEIIKNLMNSLNLPILCLGTFEGKAAFRSDPHMASRFDYMYLKDWQEGPELAKFLRNYEAQLPLRFASNLDKPESQKILVKKSGGNLAEMIRRVKSKAVEAIVSGNERITMDSLKGELLRPPVSVLIGDGNESL